MGRLTDALGLPPPTRAPSVDEMQDGFAPIPKVNGIDRKVFDARAGSARLALAEAQGRFAAASKSYSAAEAALAPQASALERQIGKRDELVAEVRTGTTPAVRIKGRDAEHAQSSAQAVDLVKDMIGDLIDVAHTQAKAARALVGSDARMAQARELRAQVAAIDDALDGLVKIYETIKGLATAPGDNAVTLGAELVKLAAGAHGLKANADALEAEAQQLTVEAHRLVLTASVDLVRKLDERLVEAQKAVKRQTKNAAQFSAEAELAYDASRGRKKGFRFGPVKKTVDAGQDIVDAALAVMPGLRAQRAVLAAQRLWFKEALTVKTDMKPQPHHPKGDGRPGRHRDVHKEWEDSQALEAHARKLRGAVEHALAAVDQLVTKAEFMAAEAIERQERWAAFHAEMQHAMFTAPA